MGYLNGGSWSLVAEFVEVESGKHSDRPQLAVALAACKKHRAKLVIAKLDRLSRNLAFIATQLGLKDGKGTEWAPVEPKDKMSPRGVGIDTPLEDQK